MFGEHAVKSCGAVLWTEWLDLDETLRGQEGIEDSKALPGQSGQGEADVGRQLVSRSKPLEVAAKVVVGELVKGVKED